MRHRVFGRKLNRDVKERKALYKSLVSALIINGKIRTTFAKGKAIARLTDKLITRAKDGSSNAVNQIASFLNRKELTDKLTAVIAPRFKDKIGGYLRIVKVGRRKSDNTEEVLLEWSVAEKVDNKKLVKSVIATPHETTQPKEVKQRKKKKIKS
ncbi:50S ribosomal protein L17 [Candidatus Gottesmanbacteria bacterium RIFCSPLOWO2_01_FULL_39_12b]|uniref:50S ribosomal protein L17 n=1 Tax=Candidatus Gottesmanbacteria bacterium RIFCSPLOWO2_01_FULL_39_12b TaxID=1798388 RepID=A0A1F6ANP3_9BACT|nr:MAG: 50S ribosomal protein L17 [Candidatus Gottesmanbacteria bacterium RIFCSPLOWO2_01_FULL_39_12b]